MNLLSRIPLALVVSVLLLEGLALSGCTISLRNPVVRKIASQPVSTVSVTLVPTLTDGATSKESLFAVSGTSAKEGAAVIWFVNDSTCSSAQASVGTVTNGTFSLSVNTNSGAWSGDGLKKHYVQLIEGASKGPCEAVGPIYTLDTTAPSVPTLSSVSPPSPSNTNRPTISGSAEDGSIVQLYSGASCGGTSIGSGTSVGGSYSIQISAQVDGTYSIRGTAKDPAGNVSGCSGVLTSLTIDTRVPTQLAFLTQPSATGNADSDLATQPQIEVRDSTGARVTTASNPITLKGFSDTVCSNEIVGSVQALTNPLAAVAGRAQFQAVRVLKVGVVRLQASSGSLTSACSSALSIAPGVFSPSASTLTSNSKYVVPNGVATGTLTATVTDANGNPLSGQTVTLASDLAGSTISGSPATTNAAGQAAFTVTAQSGGTRNFEARVGSVGIVNPAAINFSTLGTYALSRTSYVTREGSGQFTDRSTDVVVERDDSSEVSTVTLQWQTGSESDRFTPGSTLLTFDKGESSKRVPLDRLMIQNDTTQNGDLFFALRLHSPTGGYDLNERSLGKIWIVDDELPGDFMFDNSLYSGLDSDGMIPIRVLRVGEDPSGSASVDVNFVSGSATAATSFDSTSRTVVFADGEVEKVIDVRVHDTSSNQSFYSRLSNPSPGRSLRSLATAKIRLMDANETRNCDPVSTALTVNNGFGGGTGEAARPYLICSLAHLGRMRTIGSGSTSLYFKMMADIDADPSLDSNPNAAGVQPFTEITTAPLSLDGNERIVWNFRQTVTGSGHGFFVNGTVNGGVETTIQSFNLESAVITASASPNQIGLLEGRSSSSSFGTMPGVRIDIYASGRISAPGGNSLGGLVGQAYQMATQRIQNLLLVARIEGSSWIGGVIGRTAGDYFTVPPLNVQTVSVLQPSAGTAGGMIGSYEAGAQLQLVDGSFNSVIKAEGQGRLGGILGSAQADGQAAGPRFVLDRVNVQTLQLGVASRAGGVIGSLTCADSGPNLGVCNISNMNVQAQIEAGSSGASGLGGVLGELLGSGDVALTSSKVGGMIIGPKGGNVERLGGIVGNVSFGNSGALTLDSNASSVSLFNSTLNTAPAYVTNIGGLIGDMNVAASNNVAASIAGNTFSGAINLSGGGQNVGGLIGRVDFQNQGTGSRVDLLPAASQKNINLGLISVLGSGAVNSVGGLLGGLGLRGNASFSISHAYNGGKVECSQESSSSASCGGLVGSISAFGTSTTPASFLIRNSINEGTVSGRMRLGGVIGSLSIANTIQVSGILSKNYSSAGVSLQEDGSGTPEGLSGGYAGVVAVEGSASSVTISQSYSSGWIENTGPDTTDLGGFIGFATGPVSIRDSYALGNIRSTEILMRSAGFLNAGSNSLGVWPSVDKVFASQSLLGAPESLYGLVSGSGIAATNSWFNIASAGIQDSNNIAKDNNWFKDTSNFTNAGWDFSTVWESSPGVPYPTLRGMPTK